MKLKQNQLDLIHHLAQFSTMDYSSCLQMLDEQNSNDKMALSYAFRPLTKNKYISKHENGSVTILAKGRALFPDVKPFVHLGGGNLSRVNSISKTAMFFSKEDIEIVDSPVDMPYECFVPSTCWRKIRTNILSTARFTGMLFSENHRLAVYDIGDGEIEWQLRAELSLFYIIFNEAFATHATGMLLICDNNNRIEITKRIIRETMYRRRQLIVNESYEERTRPTKYSRAPIRVAWYYKHVYLTTPKMLRESLYKISEEKNYIKFLQRNNPKCWDKKLGDFEDNSSRYFINTATDLLKFVYYFTEAKSAVEYSGYQPEIGLMVPIEDIPIAEMYPKLNESEVTQLYEYRPA